MGLAHVGYGQPLMRIEIFQTPKVSFRRLEKSFFMFGAVVLTRKLENRSSGVETDMLPWGRKESSCVESQLGQIAHPLENSQHFAPESVEALSKNVDRGASASGTLL